MKRASTTCKLRGTEGKADLEVEDQNKDEDHNSVYPISEKGRSESSSERVGGDGGGKKPKRCVDCRTMTIRTSSSHR